MSISGKYQHIAIGIIIKHIGRQLYGIGISHDFLRSSAVQSITEFISYSITEYSIVLIVRGTAALPGYDIIFHHENVDLIIQFFSRGDESVQGKRSTVPYTVHGYRSLCRNRQCLINKRNYFIHQTGLILKVRHGIENTMRESAHIVIIPEYGRIIIIQFIHWLIAVHVQYLKMP